MEVESRIEASDRPDVAKMVIDQVRDLIPGGFDNNVSLDTSLYEVGLDSLARMGVVNRLEESFGIRFSEESLYDIETCRDVVEMIEQLISKRDLGQTSTQSQRSETASKPKPVPDSQREIPAAEYDVTQFPECVAFQERLSGMSAAALVNPFFRVKQRVDTLSAVVDGHEVTSYTSFDYLGMAKDPQVTQAAREAILRFGTSASASRLVGGDNTILKELDHEIASFLGTEAAMVFPSGFGTNASLLGHLFGENDLILYDELAHNSIVQGSLLSKAQRRPFPHNDFQFLDNLLQDIRSQFRRVVVAVEGVYSMDGDYPDLTRFVEVKKRHKALLYVDEAHSVGVMGATGRGICEHFGVDPAEGDIWMGTISKALGSAGGYIAGSGILIQYLKYTTPAFVFATAASPANAAAGLASLHCLQAEPQRVARLRDRSRLFLKLAREHGLNTGTSHDTPVIPVILGDSVRCVHVSHQLLLNGVDAQPILFPAVPEQASRIRFFITANHTEEQIRNTIDVLVRLLAESEAAAEGGQSNLPQ